MSLASKILLGCVFVAMLLGYFLAARTMRTHESWGTQAQQAATEFERLERDNADLRSSAADSQAVADLGIRQLRTRLDAGLVDRGRVWFPVAHPNPPDANGTVRAVALPNPPPPEQSLLPVVRFPQGVTPGLVLYAFEAGPGPDNRFGAAKDYLAEFKVLEANENEATLTPTKQLLPEEIARLAQSGPWILYERMPQDSREIMSGLAPENLAGLLQPPDAPPAFAPDELNAKVEAYLREGQAAPPDAPPQIVTIELRFRQNYQIPREEGEPITFAPGDQAKFDGMTAVQLIQSGAAEEINREFARPLSDYGYLLSELHQERRKLIGQLEQAQRDNTAIEEALADAQRELEYRQAEQQALQADLQRFREERDALVNYAAALEQQVAQNRQEIDATLDANRQLSNEIAASQLQAAEEIDSRTGTTTSSGEG